MKPLISSVEGSPKSGGIMIERNLWEGQQMLNSLFLAEGFYI